METLPTRYRGYAAQMTLCHGLIKNIGEEAYDFLKPLKAGWVLLCFAHPASKVGGSEPLRGILLADSTVAVLERPNAHHSPAP